MKNFKLYLESKEDCKKRFENILFGEFLNKKEPDTKEESELFLSLYNYIAGIGNEKLKRLHKELLTLQDCKSIYPEVLMPPIGDIAYRGTTINTTHINNQKQLKNLNIVGSIGKNHIAEFYTYEAHMPIQSWTTKLSVAEKFVKTREKIKSPNEIPIILTTKINNDFIMNPKFQNKLDDEFSMIAKEFETLRLTNKPLKCKIYINKRKYNKWVKENEAI